MGNILFYYMSNKQQVHVVSISDIKETRGRVRFALIQSIVPCEQIIIMWVDRT